MMVSARQPSSGAAAVAVDQHQVRLLGLIACSRAPHGEEGRLQDVDGGRFLDTRFAHGMAHGAGVEDGVVGLLAFSRVSFLKSSIRRSSLRLAIVRSMTATAATTGPGQRAAADLVDAGDADRAGFGAALFMAKARHHPRRLS